MNLKPLTIGDITVPIPIIQGGMGVGVSLSNLASAVTNAGGIGVISSAQIGFRESNFSKDPNKANLVALKKEIQEAKRKSNNGVIGLNVMVATQNYNDCVKTAVESGIDLIISGAGLPTKLPDLVKGSNVKIAPIVSSLKATKVILKLWDKHYNRTADMIVIEGPKAGGHLGFNADTLDIETENFETTITSIINEVEIYNKKYNKKIPVIVAGGVFSGEDIAKYMKLGADGVQMATRFVTTKECDASDAYKQAYINCKKDDITIVKSPVGMPGRAINNNFVKKTKVEKLPIKHCFNCLVPCNPANTPYCITEALINAVEGNLDNGLIFCGENAYRLNKITTVKEVFNEIENELLNA